MQVLIVKYPFSNFKKQLTRMKEPNAHKSEKLDLNHLKMDYFTQQNSFLTHHNEFFQFCHFIEMRTSTHISLTTFYIKVGYLFN